MWARNNFRKNGLGLAYARYGRGLIIYDGFDYDQYNNPIYRKLAAQELKQAFDPDNLPCSQPLGSFIITTAPDQKSLPMAAGRTYTYPVSVLGNFGYTGRVTLDASVVPADPGVSVKLDATVADLSSSEEAKATLTVTASPSASRAS